MAYQRRGMAAVLFPLCLFLWHQQEVKASEANMGADPGQVVKQPVGPVVGHDRCVHREVSDEDNEMRAKCGGIYAM